MKVFEKTPNPCGRTQGLGNQSVADFIGSDIDMLGVDLSKPPDLLSNESVLYFRMINAIGTNVAVGFPVRGIQRNQLNDQKIEQPSSLLTDQPQQLVSAQDQNLYQIALTDMKIGRHDTAHAILRILQNQNPQLAMRLIQVSGDVI